MRNETHLKSIVFSIVMVFSFSACAMAGTYSGGFGTETEPYRIGTVSDWIDLMNTLSDWDANFIMIADINLQGVPLIPVGNDLNGAYIYFRGVFDGNGHVIHNATITGRYNSSGIGLFGRIYSDSQIRNLGAEDVNMAGYSRVGGLVGCSYGTITNCYATGNIRSLEPGTTGFGGLVGKNFGTIIGCHAICNVDANNKNVGGLVGWNISNIIDSYAIATVNGNTNVGGLAGLNNCLGGEFLNNEGTLYIGSISRCFARGSVSGNRYVGGLVGSNSEPDGYSGRVSGYINDSYAVCTVTGIPNRGVVYSGGLAGFCMLPGRPPFTDPITHCYAAGRVDANGGGLIGPHFPPVPLLQDSFWDINVTGQSKSAGGIGKTTAEMMTLSTFTSTGWDFVGETTNGPNDVWFIREGKEYPRLAWENNKPVADAGPNQTAYAWIDGIAEVTLDANNSYDADGDELTYLWNWSIDGNDYETNGVDPTIGLPVGKYTFELVINDGLVNSEPNQVVITVIKPIKSTMWITPRIINNSCFGKQSIMTMLQLPAGISKKQIDCSKKLLLYPGEIEANRQFVMSYYDRRVERVVIWAYFDSSSLTDAVTKTGWLNLDVVGQLKTGQYFSGSDKVWVIKPPRKPIWHCPGYGWGW